eukprot:TRINITY_DN2444_c0_g2_i7.p1 TRINITY_DN2444_c0_g2~~TRINITY_DN2444_c0_g2_i7.p1  ORF type:complete len:366 (+),score=43.52 TRINITY_DN2444_c0_g2_i7:89-1186(+)
MQPLHLSIVQDADMKRTAECAAYSAGIILSLAIYGVLQERLMSVPYEGEYFQVAVFLVFCNRLLAVTFAVVMVLVKGEPMSNQASLWKYVAISFSNVGASACQYNALRYVSFPVQMLGKSFKMMPVMVWGIAISGKQYGVRDWIIALVITLGVCEFLVAGDIHSLRNDDRDNTSFGLGLLGMFLFLDGFTSTFQEKLFREEKTTNYNQMLYVNLGSLVISFVSIFFSGSWTYCVNFCSAHPLFVVHAMGISTSVVVAQWFIYKMVQEFGALVFALTMNVRQIVSILLSYATYGHVITPLQSMGLIMVFAALFYKNGVSMSKASTGGNAPTLPLTKSDGKPPPEEESDASTKRSPSEKDGYGSVRA